MRVIWHIDGNVMDVRAIQHHDRDDLFWSFDIVNNSGNSRCIWSCNINTERYQERNQVDITNRLRRSLKTRKGLTVDFKNTSDCNPDYKLYNKDRPKGFCYCDEKKVKLELDRIPACINDRRNLQLLEIRSEINLVENLDNLPAIKELAIWWGLKKIENLDHVPSVKTLKLQGTFPKIENLDNLPELQELDLVSKNIGKIENLDHLHGLRSLKINGAKLSKIENLDHLPKLNQLKLYSNKISRIENLEYNVFLEELDLSSNDIGKIENLVLGNLKHLNLSLNKIQKIENLGRVGGLRKLNLSNNQISKIENVNDLFMLTELDLSGNKITKIENVGNWKDFKVLRLYGNVIEKIENLEKLDGAEVDIRNNKTSHEDCVKYRKYLIPLNVKVKLDCRET